MATKGFFNPITGFSTTFADPLEEAAKRERMIQAAREQTAAQERMNRERIGGENYRTGLTDQGYTKRTEIADKGQTKRTEMTETGQTGREQMRQEGETGRANIHVKGVLSLQELLDKGALNLANVNNLSMETRKRLENKGLWKLKELDNLGLLKRLETKGKQDQSLQELLDKGLLNLHALDNLSKQDLAELEVAKVIIHDRLVNSGALAIKKEDTRSAKEIADTKEGGLNYRTGVVTQAQKEEAQIRADAAEKAKRVLTPAFRARLAEDAARLQKDQNNFDSVDAFANELTRGLVAEVDTINGAKDPASRWKMGFGSPTPISEEEKQKRISDAVLIATKKIPAAMRRYIVIDPKTGEVTNVMKDPGFNPKTFMRDRLLDMGLDPDQLDLGPVTTPSTQGGSATGSKSTEGPSNQSGGIVPSVIRQSQAGSGGGSVDMLPSVIRPSQAGSGYGAITSPTNEVPIIGPRMLNPTRGDYADFGTNRTARIAVIAGQPYLWDSGGIRNIRPSQARDFGIQAPGPEGYGAITNRLGSGEGMFPYLPEDDTWEANAYPGALMGY